MSGWNERAGPAVVSKVGRQSRVHERSPPRRRKSSSEFESWRHPSDGQAHVPRRKQLRSRKRVVAPRWRLCGRDS